MENRRLRVFLQIFILILPSLFSARCFAQNISDQIWYAPNYNSTTLTFDKEGGVRFFNLYGELEGTYEEHERKVDIVFTGPPKVLDNNEISDDTSEVSLLWISPSRLISLTNKKYGSFINVPPRKLHANISGDSAMLSLSFEGYVDSLFVEQHLFNRWIVVDTLVGETREGIKVIRKLWTHEGENKFRFSIPQGFGARLKLYRTLVFYSNAPEIKGVLDAHSDKIIFDRPSFYEIFSEDDILVQNGYGKSIDLKPLEPGTYFLNYGTQLGEKISIK